MSALSKSELEITANLRRASRLRQSILKRAFEGKLVPQDRKDEPASAMLERIKFDRSQADKFDIQPTIGKNRNRRGKAVPSASAFGGSP